MIIGVIILFLVGSVVLFKTYYSSSSQTYSSGVPYTSKDLKISFQYPKNWHVDEKNYDILIASYSTKIGEGSIPA